MESLYTLVGIMVNIAAFCVAALALHRLTIATVQDLDTANMAVIIFCFNPASVFYSAVYTEALFAACTWVGLLLLPTHFWGGVAALTAASAARSNGTLAAWFLIHRFLSETFRTKSVSFTEAWRAVAGCAAIFAPYIGMQVAAYRSYCSSSAVNPPEWCTRAIPSLYSYVQERYWDVGFLTFYSKFERVSWVYKADGLHYKHTCNFALVGLLPCQKRVLNYGSIHED